MKNTNHVAEVGHEAQHVGHILIGLLVGGLAGAGAALLLAPQSGKETRAQIEQKTIELRELTAQSVDDAVAQVKSKTQQITAEVREKAGEWEQQGRGILARQLEHVSEAAEAGKAVVAG